jgi:hypothetical protein
MSLVCAVPSYAELAAITGQDVIVIGSGHTASRLRLDKVEPVERGDSVFFRALLTAEDESIVRNGNHLARVGDFLVRLRLNRVVEHNRDYYEAHAQAHVEELELATV